MANEAQSCLVFPHRGGMQEVAQNSWAAVEHVLDLGLPWMETDLRLSADGVVVLSHDPHLARITGQETPISQMPWATLARIDAGDGRPPVRLDELLHAFPQLHLNLDLKESRVLTPALRAVRAAQAFARVRFASFSSRRLSRLRQQEPLARTSLGVGEVAGMLVRRRRAHPRIDAVQVPPAVGAIPLVTARFVARAHASGLQVHVWTINTPKQIRQLAALGVDALITDVPTLALEILGQR